MQRYRPHPEPWGEFVDAKSYTPMILARQLIRSPPGLVLLSSVIDPYQPLEASLQLIRKCLEQLLRHDFPTTILTKSALVTRDKDIFREFHSIEVGLSITNLEEEDRRCFEPQASSMDDRIKALGALSDAGIQTYAFVGPLLPILSEKRLEELGKRLVEARVGRILVDRLKIKAGNWDSMRKHLRPALRQYAARV
jgi:DNA repair photolyase